MSVRLINPILDEEGESGEHTTEILLIGFITQRTISVSLKVPEKNAGNQANAAPKWFAVRQFALTRNGVFVFKTPLLCHQKAFQEIERFADTREANA
jgi:hypothetical protein